MRPRTVVGLLVVLLVFGSLVAVTIGGLGGDIAGVDGGPASETTLSHQWTSDTGVGIEGNHHAVAAGRVDGAGLVFAPLSGRADTEECALTALEGDSGGERWSYQIPPQVCAIHAVADPTLADFDDDGDLEVVAATTEEAVVALDARTGEEELRFDTSTYGYTRPLVADVTGDGEREIVAVDVRGSVSVVRPDGTAVWTRQLDAYTWGQPAVADVNGDGSDELVVAVSDGDVHVFEGDGSTAWRTNDSVGSFDSSITWMTTGQADDDPQTEVVVATVDGVVAAIDGGGERTADGGSGEQASQGGGEPTIQWRRDLGAYAAVHAFGDGDGDGTPEVYAVARDGTLQSLDAANGTVEWTTTLTTADVQMMPPPALGDVDGDGRPELVAVTNDGIVSLVDPRTGDVLDSYQREVSVFARPTLADVDGDGSLEVFVIYGDGRVVAFSGS